MPIQPLIVPKGYQPKPGETDIDFWRDDLDNDNEELLKQLRQLTDKPTPTNNHPHRLRSARQE